MAIRATKGLYKVRKPNRLILPNHDPLLSKRIIQDKEGNTLFEYRSKWEAYYMNYLEDAPEVVKWGYECDTINYLDPTTILPDGSYKQRRYFIDFVVYYTDGTIEYVEVKPFCQSVEPKEPKTKKTKGVNTKKYDTYLKACETYCVNQAKWNYCKKYLENLSLSLNVKFKFVIATEKDRLKNIIKK